VRYVYFFFMRKRIKKGFPFHRSHTPSEIRAEMESDKKFTGGALFTAYNARRYIENTENTGGLDELRRLI
jgi:hypothetical protein